MFTVTPFCAAGVNLGPNLPGQILDLLQSVEIAGDHRQLIISAATLSTRVTSEDNFQNYNGRICMQGKQLVFSVFAFSLYHFLSVLHLRFAWPIGISTGQECRIRQICCWYGTSSGGFTDPTNGQIHSSITSLLVSTPLLAIRIDGKRNQVHFPVDQWNTMQFKRLY